MFPETSFFTLKLIIIASADDIFVRTMHGSDATYHKPFGMILTEAMSCERPVISTYRGGIPEIVVHNQTGLLVKPDDPLDLAEAILQLLTSEKQRAEMGIEGKKRVVQEFSWEKTSQVLLNFLDVISGNNISKDVV